MTSPKYFSSTDASILTTTTNTKRQKASEASGGSTNADLSCSPPFALLSIRSKQLIQYLAMMGDSARFRLTDQHSSRQKKRRRSDADAGASDAGGQRTSSGCTASSSHRLSRHTCTAAHALVLLLSANLMFCTDAFSNENVLSRNNFGRATLDVPTFDHHGPATGAFSNTKRYSRSGAKVILSASRERTDTTSSSGSGGSSSSSSSRFGVRKRVKSVIQKAKSRKIAKAAREEAAEAEAEIQHIIEEDDKIFEEEKSKESEVTIQVVSETESSSGPQAVDSDVTVEEVEEVNGSVVAQAEKETDIDNDTDNASSPSLSGEKITQTSEQAADNEAKSTTLESKDIEEAPEDKDGGDNDAAAEDVIVADVEPLPFELPNLTDEQQRQLDMGERVQFQNDMGREGSGFVVLDVKAPPDVVWECLLDFQSYPETIPTVREVTMYTNTHLSGDYRSEKPVAFEDGTMATLAHGVPSVTRAAFTLSKFRLKIAAIHRYTPHPVGDYMVFTLDPACTNLVLKDAKGIWHTQSNPDNKGEDYTRVWLLCEVKVSKLLPQWITDYAARRAMPRATTWLRPQVEAANALWLSKKRRRRRN